MQKVIAEKLAGDVNARVKDMRNAFEQLKIGIGDKILTQEQLNFYLGHGIGPQALKNIYKMSKLPLTEQLEIARRVEKAFGIDSGSGKYQVKAIGEATMDASVKKYLNTLIERNPGLKVAFEKVPELQLNLIPSIAAVFSAIVINELLFL